MAFKEISVSELSFNPFDKISREWFLLTAGDEKGYNTMTAAWGFMGFMWGKNVIETVIRPSRHTIKFVEESPLFTVSFFDVDGTAAFEEANLIFICRKLYAQDMEVSCLIPEEQGAFGSEAPHKAFIGEIVKVLVRE